MAINMFYEFPVTLKGTFVPNFKKSYPSVPGILLVVCDWILMLWYLVENLVWIENRNF